MQTIEAEAPVKTAQQSGLGFAMSLSRPATPLAPASVVSMPAAVQAASPAVKREITVNSAELSKLLNRALNTMEPQDWPNWVNDLLGGHVDGGGIAAGMLSGGTCTISVDAAPAEAVRA